MAGLAAASPPSILGDPAWFTDTGATDHITGDLDRLTIREKCPWKDRNHTSDGSGLHIAHRGHAILPTPSANLKLRNILHVPNADKNLLSVNHLAVDNHAYLKYYPTHFLMKDLITKRVLLQGRCENGLYPIRQSPHRALFSVRLSAEDCDARLGHPSTQVVHHVLSLNKIASSSRSMTHVFEIMMLEERSY